VHSVIPRLLKLFKEYQIHCTWAVVGFLFYESLQKLIEGLPNKRPEYINIKLCPYRYISSIDDNDEQDIFHFGPALIKMIISEPGQEIASHTFSHYYCLEKGQDRDAFEDDLEAAIRVANKYGLKPESLVFPKNQINKDYLPILKDKGIKAYRGNEPSWIYQGRSDEAESLLRRGLRILDAYINISGHNAYNKAMIKRQFPFNISSSRFLRPYSKKLSRLEPRRLNRILADMSYAAQNGLVYHLWWHPHNFGINQEENLKFLQNILAHFTKLKNTYAMESLNMQELSANLLEE
jgi:peptidoglycan/xylan/chitin deacetylase (PgdA/CDA1 family)